MKNPEYFDEQTVKRVNEILKVAEELVRKNTDIDGWEPTKKEWGQKLRQTYFPLTYYDEHYWGLFTRSDKAKHPTLKYLKKDRKGKGEVLGELIYYWNFVRAKRVGTKTRVFPSGEFERKGKMSKFYAILLNEEELSSIRKDEGEEVFDGIVLYVFIHELLHMIKFIHIEILRKKWQDEARTRSQTCEVFEQSELPVNVKDRVLKSCKGG